jgi:hypothetical protein
VPLPGHLACLRPSPKRCAVCDTPWFSSMNEATRIAGVLVPQFKARTFLLFIHETCTATPDTDFLFQTRFCTQAK